MLAAFAPMATDMYLPALHLIAQDFHASQSAAESSVSLFFLGLALGQALYGPLADRWGRRAPLLLGIGLYAGATLACLLVSDITQLVALRVLQAMGGAAGMIVGRAIITDLYSERESARAFSLLMMVMTIAPIVAPVLGGFIITTLGWRAVFWAMLVFGLVAGVLVWRFIPETLAPDKRSREGFASIARGWLALLADPAFRTPALVGGLGQGCMFAFITGSPGVFMGGHGVSAQGFGWLFALVACSLIISAFINRQALRHTTPETMLGRALLLNVAAGWLALAAAPLNELVALLVPLWFAIGSLGFLGANAAAVAMAHNGGRPGSASSLVGVLQFAIAFVVSSAVAAAAGSTAYPMALAIVGCGTVAALLWFGAGRRLARR